MKHVPESPELPVPELDGLYQCLAALALDPAVRHRLDQALSQSAEQVRQRLACLTQPAERLALLGEIATKMTHEIRNFQYTIVLHADLLEEEIQQPTADSPAQIVESITDIRTAVTRLYDMVQDYFTLARLPGLQREPKELEALLQEIVLEVQEQAETQGVTLRLEGLARLGRVCLHHSTLQRALLSLVQRALYAMPQGGTLTLRGYGTASQAVLEVRDTGSSIPDEQLHLLFDPFHSTGSAWTGLRFSMVRDVVTMHEGTVTVRSATGHGTTFTITLPLVATALPTPTSGAADCG